LIFFLFKEEEEEEEEEKKEEGIQHQIVHCARSTGQDMFVVTSSMDDIQFITSLKLSHYKIAIIILLTVHQNDIRHQKGQLFIVSGFS